MTETGIWTEDEANKYHASSPKLAQWLISFLPKDQPVIDLGAGNGFYCNELSKAGFEAIGVEGSDLKNSLHDNMVIHDLTEPLILKQRGSVLCLETLEHVPEYGERNLLDIIRKHATGIVVLSWATPGQPGVGHVNCKTHTYAIEQMDLMGFDYDEERSFEARDNADDHTSWFKRNLMVFKKYFA